MEVELDKKKLQFTNENGEKVNVDIDQEQTEKEEEAFESNHYSNLAEELPEQEINLIGKLYLFFGARHAKFSLTLFRNIEERRRKNCKPKTL